MKKNRIRSFITAAILCLSMIAGFQDTCITALAKGTEFTAMQDVYYTKDNCIVYSEPTYTSAVLTTLGANIPVQVVGAYSNGWFRINIGVICYVKKDSVTTAGAIGLPIKADKQIADAQRIASEIGYEFVNLKLNDQKMIKKDIFNSYIDQKVMLYAKVDDEVGVLFKMLYADKVKSDIDLKFTKTATTGHMGGRKVELIFGNDTELLGQIAIFQFKEGYDKAVDIYTTDLNTASYISTPMNTYYTEFSEFAYAPMTQISNMYIVEDEVDFSLTNKQRNRMADLQRGIKYLSYDSKDYRDSIHSRLRKDTEYVDYQY